jgi:deazaflavin-dependent oxidoreductase (nitroreductase family)
MMPTDEVLQDNASVIDEYRAHGGEVAGLGFPVLLLTTTGTRSGRRTTVPLGFKVDAGQVFVVASNGGAPRHPGWFHNLVANPAVIVELGDQAYEGRAVVAHGEERGRLFDLMKVDAPGLRDFEQRADRIIPVVVLEDVPAPGEFPGNAVASVPLGLGTSIPYRAAAGPRA